MPGDQRLVVIRELDDLERPWLWNLADGTLEPIGAVEEPGAFYLADWYPDGEALLLRRDHEARDALLRLDLDTRESSVIVPAAGTITQAGVRPDGDVWYRAESGVEPPAIRNLGGAVVLSIPGVESASARTTRSRPCGSRTRTGTRIQGWLVRPDGEPPFPTIVSPHGGPEYHNTDAFDPRRLAYADHGFAVLLVNYRGSTGYGAAFRQAL